MKKKAYLSPPWYKAADADDALGKAFLALHGLKGFFDSMEEIPSHYMSYYKAIMKTTGEVAEARRHTNQLRMQTKSVSKTAGEDMPEYKYYQDKVATVTNFRSFLTQGIRLVDDFTNARLRLLSEYLSEAKKALREIEDQANSIPRGKGKVLTSKQGKALEEMRYSLEEIKKSSQDMKGVFFFQEGHIQFKQLVHIEIWADRVLRELRQPK